MRIVVFGANGKVGSLVTQKLLDKGYSVRACIHGKNSLPKHTKLETVQVDIHNKESVENALRNCDVVVSTLGSWGTPTKDILEQAMTHIIPLMQKNDIQRIITLTGADARADEDEITFTHMLMHGFIKISPARKILEDGEKHISLLKKSNLLWTTLRSPIMNEKGTLNYILTTKRPKPWQTIHRHAVAQAIVDQIEDKGHFSNAPYLSR